MLDPEKILEGARGSVSFDRDSLLPELLAFGEVENALVYSKLDERAVAAIGVLAMNHFAGPGNVFLDKAICLAIVEFIEGQQRPLRRKRRIYPKGDQREV